MGILTVYPHWDQAMKQGDKWRKHQAVIDANPPSPDTSYRRQCSGTFVVVAASSGLPGNRGTTVVECDECYEDMGVQHIAAPEHEQEAIPV